jgi:hypothetical protein
LQYHTLKPDLIVETQRRLAERIAARFPESGLRQVAAELLDKAREATVRAEAIRRPNVPLRVAVAVVILGGVLVLLAGVAFGIHAAPAPEFKTDTSHLLALFDVGERALRTLVFLGAVALFLVSVEARLKRRRALAALHELRAMAHVIDMHQVAKDPEALLRHDPADPAAGHQTTKTLFDLSRYLNYCNELLAILSKIAALYVQDFPDAPTVSAVDQVESLCSGLSEKIWQKIMVLDQFREQQQSSPPADRPQRGAGTA